MKALIAVMVLLSAAVFGIILLGDPLATTGPEPIAYGKDTCARCRMHLARPGFAGELRDREGILKKYDDLGCLLLAIDSAHAEVPQAYAEVHPTGALIPLLTATLVVDSKTITPMGYGVLAFADAESAAAHVSAQGGRLASLEELLKDRERFNTRPSGPADHGGHGDHAEHGVER